MKVHFLRKTNLAVLIALLGIGAQGASAATTTLTFDEFPDGTALTTEYQGLGVTVTGTIASIGILAPWPENTSPNVAFSPVGLMTFTLDPAILGNIQSVSAYISGSASVGIYAYDAQNALVGQAITPGATNNMLLTVTSSGNPISRVSIHDGGSNFVIDTLSFMTDLPVVSYTDLMQQLHSAVFALSPSDFIDSSNPTKLKFDVTKFESLESKKTANAALYEQLLKIESEINAWVNPSTNRDNLLNVVDQLINLTPKS
jgi:hypothetical protein